MKSLYFLAVSCFIALAAPSLAGVSLEVAPIEEWELTSSSASFTIDFLGDPGEWGEFHLCIREGDSGRFTDTFTIEPAAGDMGHGVVMTAFTPPQSNDVSFPAANTETVYYSNYMITVEDSTGNFPGGLLAQLTFYQQGYGTTLIEVFKDLDYSTSLASMLIAIVDFPGGGTSQNDDDDIPVPGDHDIPEPATVVLLGLGGLGLLRRR